MSDKSKIKCSFLLLILLCVQISLAQEQRIADSLTKIYSTEANISNLEKMELLRNLAFNEVTNIELSIKYANELIALATKENNYLYLHRGYFQKANKYRYLSDLDIALDAVFKSLDAAKKASYIIGQGNCNVAIADIYSSMGNSKNAEYYYAQSIELLRKTDNTTALASALLNAGDQYFKNKNYTIALQNFNEAAILFKKVEYTTGTAYSLGNIGMVYAEQGKDALAKKYIGNAIELLEELEDYYAISDYLTYMSDIYSNQNDYKTALSYAKRSLELAEEFGLKDQINKSNLTLSDIYLKLGNANESLKHYKNHIIYRDSVTNIESVQKIADLRTDFEVSQKQTEIDLLDQRRKNQRIVTYAIGAALFFIALLAFLWYRRYLFIRKTKQIIEKERDRSDSLLLNILPEETAIELKLNGNVKAKKHDAVTVLFSDFKGFTSYSEKLSPEELVKTVDFYFSKFDTIMEDYGLEKIKTIGDAYMCAGGLNGNEKEAAQNMILAAKDIIDFVEKTKSNNATQEFTFDIRIGINTGPVVAGVVGSKKFAYDIWGDTVNIASRMESMSQPGKINISEGTHALISDQWTCEYRGEIEVKNRGYLKMYFVND
ncbi:adenylate/guanylate cyclase domain-containing protein [Flavobacterium orientale]|uniref:adenylate/guanylate cyclase domain-containing protein n=1 Tax=Flavobacterium orientale TaxID=1756020 RepID=UPI0016657040|nr:adenylate/guanylate cyclase domain-containing protein [Flavobacterium orientale]